MTSVTVRPSARRLRPTQYALSGCCTIASGPRHELCRAVHAEQNAIIQAAMHGISIEGATLYCTRQPCILCAKMMINTRVKKVVYLQSYPDQTALDFLQQAGIEVVKVEGKDS